MGMEAAGMALRVFREVRGLNQKEAAKKAKIHHNRVSAWERGEGVPRLDNFDAYMEMLRAPVDLLMDLVRKKTATPLDGLRAAVEYLRNREGLSDDEIAKIDAWRSTYGSQAVHDILGPELKDNP